MLSFKKEVGEDAKSKILEIKEIMHPKRSSNSYPEESVTLFGKKISQQLPSDDEDRASMISQILPGSGEEEPIYSPQDRRYSHRSSQSSEKDDAEFEGELEIEEEEEEEFAELMTPEQFEAASALLEMEIRLMESEKILANRKKAVARQKEAELNRKNREIDNMWSKMYPPAGKQLSMLKTSMRFQPSINIKPNVQGHPDDPPYLMKTPGLIIDRKRKFEYSIVSKQKPQDAASKLGLSKSALNAQDEENGQFQSSNAPQPAFGLNWPSEASQVVYRSHQNLLCAFLDYCNKKAEAEIGGSLTAELYDPNLSISCAIACGKSPYPPKPRIFSKYPDGEGGLDEISYAESLLKEGAQDDGTASLHPEEDGSFAPLTEGYMTQDQNEGIPQTPAYFNQDKSSSIGHFVEGPLPDIGYIDHDGEFVPLDAGEVPPEGTKAGYMDAKGHFHEGPPRHQSGYMDGNGKFKALAPGETAPPGMKTGHIEELEHQPGYIGADGTFRALSIGEVAPYGTTTGWRDSHGNFHESAISHIGYTDANGEFHSILPGESPPAGAKLGRMDAHGRFHEGATPQIGYKDANGTFHILHPGEHPPPGTLKGYMDPLGNFHEDTSTMPGYLDESGRFIALAPGQHAPPGTKTGFLDSKNQFHDTTHSDKISGEIPAVQVGYRDANGEFHALQPGYQPPEGTTPGLMDIQGNFHEGATPGYLDNQGNFKALAPGQQAPPGTRVGFMDSQGQFHDATHDHTSSRRGSNESNKRESVPQVGYKDANGNFHAVQPGQQPPEGATTGYMDAQGNFHEESLPISGFVDENGSFQALEPGQQVPSGTKTGFIDSTGQLHDTSSLQGSGSSRRGSKPQAGYKDRNGKFHTVQPAQHPPAGVSTGYIDEQGNFHEEALPVSGYLDEEGNFHSLDQQQQAPRGASTGFIDSEGRFHDTSSVQGSVGGGPTDTSSVQGSVRGGSKPQAGYKDAAGKFHVVQPGQQPPAGVATGYTDTQGNFHEEALPVSGYVDENGGFQALEAGQQAPPGAKTGFIDSAGRVHDTSSVQGSVRGGAKPQTGYKDATGKFHSVQPGQQPPAGASTGYVDAQGNFHEEALPVSGYVDENGVFQALAPGQQAPRGASTGFMDADGRVHDTTSVYGSATGAPNPQAGYIDANGKFHALQPGQHPPTGAPTGYTDAQGHFHEETLPVAGYVDQNGSFKTLTPGQQAPPGTKTGFIDSEGRVHDTSSVQGSVKGPTTGYIDANGKFHALQHGQQPPTGAPTGYIDSQGKFISAPLPQTGQPLEQYSQKRPSSSRPGSRGNPLPPGAYIEDPNELVEAEILDEHDLDENGKPKIKVVLRHRSSIEPPPNARDNPDGSKTWIEGDEEVTEMTYLDHDDLDEQGRPKEKKVRVRRKSRLRAGEEWHGDENEYNLRSQPLTQSEREQLLEFQRHIAVQVELDRIVGSLDLGEVVRKSFRIYSHGGSVDIELDPTAVARLASEQTKEIATRRKSGG